METFDTNTLADDSSMTRTLKEPGNTCGGTTILRIHSRRTTLDTSGIEYKFGNCFAIKY